jgi:hypothetical protein
VKCKDLKYNFPDYLRNKIDDELKNIIDEHLISCESCKNEMEHLKSTIEIIDEYKIPEPDEKYFINFLPHLNERMGKEQNTVNIPGWLTKFALPFSTLALAALIITFVSRPDYSRSAISKSIPVRVDDVDIEELALIESPSPEIALKSRTEINTEVQEAIDKKMKEALFASNDELFAQNVDMESVINGLSEEEVTQVLDRLKEK